MARKAITLSGLAAATWLGVAGCAIPEMGGSLAEDPPPRKLSATSRPEPKAGPGSTDADPAPQPQPPAGRDVSDASEKRAPQFRAAAEGELTLEEAIALTFEANPDLKSALERTEIAAGILANARAQFYPTLASNVEYQFTDNPLRKFTFLLSQGIADPNQLFPLPGVEDLFHNQLHFQQNLYTGGLRMAQERAAAAERDASLFSLSAVRNQLVYQVAEAYYRVFQARELVGVRREGVTQVESQLETVRSRFAAKTVVRSDVLKAEFRLTEAQTALNTSVNSLALAYAVLENVMGVRLHGRPLPEKLPPAPWSPHVDPEAAVEGEEGLPSDVEAAVAEAVAARPELDEVASRMTAAEHLVRAAKAGKYPTVGVVGDYDLNRGSRSTNNSYFLGVALSLNLVDCGRTTSKVREAQARVRELGARHERARLDVELDVRRAALRLKDARERVKSTASSLASAEENLRQVESRYREQTATTTELLDAQLLLSDARVQSTTVAAEVEIARAALERAVGRLAEVVEWQDVPVHE